MADPDRPQPSSRPLILEIGDDPHLEAGPEPAEAPPIEDGPEDAAAARVVAAAARPRAAGSLAGRLFWFCLGGLLLLAAGLAVEGLVAGLFAQAALLGWVGTALVAGLVIALVAAALVEMAGIARLGRIDGLRALAEAGYGGDAAAAQRVLTGLRRLLRPQAAAADGLARLEAAASDTPDPVERLALAESLVLSPLDTEASAAVEAAARRVAAATAVLPLPILDVAVVLASTLSMIRAVAAAYGGRAGWLGSWRLLKAVAAQLVASGLISATDDLLDPVIGQGIAGRLSKRLGEATFNAAITARVGVIAISVCRPLPFAETPPPRARTILWRAIGDWQSKSSPE